MSIYTQTEFFLFPWERAEYEKDKKRIFRLVKYFLKKSLNSKLPPVTRLSYTRKVYSLLSSLIMHKDCYWAYEDVLSFSKSIEQDLIKFDTNITTDDFIYLYALVGVENLL